jgi:hypothetical protein
MTKRKMRTSYATRMQALVALFGLIALAVFGATATDG